MRIISFDVGIKNLSFCILNTDNPSSINIDKWDVINLCGDIKHICGEFKKDKQCSNIPKFYKNNDYFCKIHARNKSYLIPPIELTEKYLKKQKLKDLLVIADKYTILYEKNINKNALLEKIKEYINVFYFDIVAVSSKASHFDLIQLGINMREKLDAILYTDNNEQNIDKIIIENQIGPLANRMKTLQGMIAQYFIMKNYTDIVFYSASNKLKFFMCDDVKTYKERKKISITITTDILSQYNELTIWNVFFMKHVKKDDLADSFLQGLSYFIQNLYFILNK